MAGKEEIDAFVANFSDQLDNETALLIANTLKVNGFRTRLQLKLITSNELNLMFQDLKLGAKRLLQYNLDILRDESPLPARKNTTNDLPTGNLEESEGRKSSVSRKLA